MIYVTNFIQNRHIFYMNFDGMISDIMYLIICVVHCVYQDNKLLKTLYYLDIKHDFINFRYRAPTKLMLIWDSSSRTAESARARERQRS